MFNATKVFEFEEEENVCILIDIHITKKNANAIHVQYYYCYMTLFEHYIIFNKITNGFDRVSKE
jgi:hypothetical protein